MINSIIFFIFYNIVFITTFLWVISYFGDKFFKKKNNRYAEEVFECGFLTNHNYNIRINLNVFFIFNLLILYDVEFMFLIPYFYNLEFGSVYSSGIFFIFLGLILCSLMIDWSYLSITWHH